MKFDRGAASFVVLSVAGALSVAPAGAQDSVLVAEDGLNTGGIGAYSVSYGPGSAGVDKVNTTLWLWLSVRTSQVNSQACAGPARSDRSGWQDRQ